MKLITTNLLNRFWKSGIEPIKDGLKDLSDIVSNHKTSADHDGRYYTESEVNNLLNGKSNTSHAHGWGAITDKPTTFPATGHTHDERYYTESEVNNLLNNKQNANTAINTSNIGNQSVNYANTSNSSNNSGYATSAGYANSAGAVTWGNVSGKPSTYPPSNHSHGYLPSSGGTINGNVGITGGLSADYIYTQTPDGTLHINVGGWVNIETDRQLQVRNKADNAWCPVAASAFNMQSSKRYKENIADMEDNEARKLLQYRPVTYDYINKNDGTECMGLIAEEVDKICQYPVAYDGMGRPDGLDYSKFVPQIIKMVQIQQQEIEWIKEKIGKTV